jgi:hypothetical protein
MDTGAMTMHDRLKKHFAWKKRLARRLPDLATRTFALRGKAYPGYGFHYALERSLGSVIKIATTFDYQDLGSDIIDEVIVEAFHVELAAAEREARS